MVTIQERLLADMTKAQKERNKLRLGAIRWIRDALQKRAKEVLRELDDNEAAEVLASVAKKYKDSIEQARNVGRMDIAEKEESELSVLEEYLPKALAEVEIEALVDEAIISTGAKGAKDMGAVMKVIKPKWSGRADGKLVSDIVKKKLA